MRSWWANMFSFDNYEVGKTVHAFCLSYFLVMTKPLYSIAFLGAYTFHGDLKILEASEKYMVLDF